MRNGSKVYGCKMRFGSGSDATVCNYDTLPFIILEV